VLGGEREIVVLVVEAAHRASERRIAGEANSRADGPSAG
jgi:hypothetical protein